VATEAPAPEVFHGVLVDQAVSHEVPEAQDDHQVEAVPRDHPAPVQDPAEEEDKSLKIE